MSSTSLTMTECNPERAEIARISRADRERLIEICKDIATNGSSVDPNGREFREGVALTWLFPLCRHLGISLERVKDGNITTTSSTTNNKRASLSSTNITGSALDGLFTDFYVLMELDGNGRITHLEINTKGVSTSHLLDLPPVVGELEQLKQLVVHNCRSLPWWELSRLPHLEYLHLSRCSDFLENFPLQMRLVHLKHLTICRFLLPPSLPLFPWIKGQLPSLEKLILTDQIVDTTARCISGAFPRFTNDAMTSIRHNHHKFLQKIELFGCGIDDHQLATLLLEVLPKFPTLSSLVLSQNNIRSLEPIVRRMDEDCHHHGNRHGWATFRTSLRRLHLSNNPIEKFLRADAEDTGGEVAIVCRFLAAFSTVAYLSGHGSWHRDIHQALFLNWAGRSLVDGRIPWGSLPPSVWPLVLARLTQPKRQTRPWRSNPWDNRGDSMTEETDDSPGTALFVLLRRGPVLLGGYR